MGLITFLGREAILDRTNPKPVEYTIINTYYFRSPIAALLSFPSAHMQHILALLDGNAFCQLIPWTVGLSISGIYGPYRIHHTTRLVPRECGPVCFNTHSSSLVLSPYHVIVYHVESHIHAHVSSNQHPTLLSHITFYVVIFGPYACLGPTSSSCTENGLRLVPSGAAEVRGAEVLPTSGGAMWV